MNRTLYIFDFDDTLIKSDAQVIIYHLDGTLSQLNSAEFARYKERPGDEFDFSQFEIYPPGGQTISSTFKRLQKVAQSLGPRNVIILTARSSAGPVRQFLKDQGLKIDIPIIAVGNSNPSAKAAYAVKRLGTGNYDNVHVYEDNHKNINAIQNVAKQMGVRFDYTLINVDDNPRTHLREFIQHTLLEKKKKKKKTPAAGIIVTRLFPEGLKVLGLRLYGKYDIPKGKIEAGESIFDAALRETAEEAGITDLRFPYGLQPISSGHITVFIGETSQDPIICKNPQTNIYEHHGVSWLDWDELIQKVHSRLRPLIIQAQKIIIFN
jgi:bis(5'-nucleosidyl)-tetraphosphatase